MQPAKVVLGQWGVKSNNRMGGPGFHLFIPQTQKAMLLPDRETMSKKCTHDGTCGFHIGLPLYLSPQVNRLEK